MSARPRQGVEVVLKFDVLAALETRRPRALSLGIKLEGAYPASGGPLYPSVRGQAR